MKRKFIDIKCEDGSKKRINFNKRTRAPREDVVKKAITVAKDIKECTGEDVSKIMLRELGFGAGIAKEAADRI